MHLDWRQQDIEEPVESDDSTKWQKDQGKNDRIILFGFAFQETQVEAICTVFYDQKDLFVLAQTGFRKSLIFQLIFFMMNTTGLVIILMPLKHLEAEQNAVMN